MEQDFKYRAFITYSHRDKEWGDWLHRSIETYSVPSQIRGSAGRDGPIPARLYPVFRDREELPTAASLSEQIAAALQDSAILIVICSPNSANSHWVNEEILTFKRIGRENRVLAIIVGGEPNASEKAGIAPEQECFPEALKFRIGQDGRLSGERTEPIAADARPEGDGKTNALLKVVAGILGVSFDALKRREDQRRARRRYAISAAFFSVSGAAGFYAWDRIDRGTLEADAFPQSTIIKVDETEVGARIRNMPLRSGIHQLVATAKDYQEVRRPVQIPFGGKAVSRFFLNKALRWSFFRPDIQSGMIVFPAGSDTVFAHNELGQITFISTANGKQVGSIATPDGNRRTFLGLDLGKTAGRAIISAVEREQGSEILALATELPLRILWRWQGPPSRFDNAVGLSVVALPAQDQDTMVASTGRDGVVYFLAGSTGQMLGEVRIAPSPIPFPPVLVSGNSLDGPSVAAFFWAGGSVAKSEDVREGKLMLAIGIHPGSRRITWQKEFGTAWSGPSAQFVVDGKPHIALWNDHEWQTVDATTGLVRNSGTLKGALLGQPTFYQLPKQGGMALVFQYKDPTLPMASVRARDGSLVWQGPDRLSAEFQPRDPENGGVLQNSEGFLLINREHELVAVDPGDGRVAWRIAGEVTGAIAGDWDGDGKMEVFVTIRGTGLVCLDGLGQRLWSVALESAVAVPRRVIRSPEGGATSEVIVHAHAVMFGVVQGPRVVWEQAPDASIRASPIVAGKTADGRPIVIATANWGGKADLRAFDAEGNDLWTADERFTQNLPPAVADLDGDGVDEIVGIGSLVGGGRPHLLSYRIADGRRLTALPLAFTSWLSVTPVIADFRGIGKRDVALNTWDERSITMVDGRTGATLWRFETSQPNMGGLSSADLDGDGHPDVLAASGDGNLYALRGRDGAVLWKAAMEPGFKGNGLPKPIIADLGDGNDPSVLAMDGHARLYIVKARTGEIVWRSSVEGGAGVSGHPILVQKDLRKIILAPQGTAGIVAYDAASRLELWRSPAGQIALSTPAVAAWGGAEYAAVFFVSGTGRGYLLDITSGRVMWQDQVFDGRVEADPVIADLNGGRHPDVVVAGDDVVSGKPSPILRVLNGLGNFGAPWGQAR